MIRLSLLVLGACLLAGTGLAQEHPKSAGPADPKLIEDLVAANRILAAHGVLDGFGHVSVRHNLDPDRFLISRSLAPELVTADDIQEYDLNAVAVDPNAARGYGERHIHAAIYRARPDVQAVVHSHSPSVIPFGVSSIKMRPLYHMASFMLDGLPVFDIKDKFGVTDMLVSSPERGDALVVDLGDSAAVLMRGHGIAVVGPGLPYAVARSIYTEINAGLQRDAIALGGDIEYLDAAEGQARLDAGEHDGYERPWQLWKRQVMEEIQESAASD